MTRAVLFSITIVLMLTGCGKQLSYVNTNEVISTKNIILKDYELNKTNNAYIGSTMIRVKNYKTITTSTDKMTPTEDFVFNVDGTKQFNFTKNDIFSIKGNWEIDGKSYKAVTNPKLPTGAFTFHLLINEDGTIINKVVNVSNLPMTYGEATTVIWDYKYNPETVRLKTVVTSTNEIEKGKVNYELIYTGTNKDSFMITYREYTKDDLARSSFFQNLTYPKTSKKIRFRNLLLKINSIDGEKISFTVLQDSL